MTCSQEVTHCLTLQVGPASLRGTFFQGPGDLSPAGSGLELSSGLRLSPDGAHQVLVDLWLVPRKDWVICALGRGQAQREA